MEGELLVLNQVDYSTKILYWSYIMPNNANAVSIEIEEFEETEDFGKDDFGFILGPNGELKTFMIPEHLMTEPPEEVKMILSIFGIDDINDLENKVLH
jgi:hypothetical protein